MKRAASPEVLALMGETPAFRNDETVLPLQAADLWAGVTREWGEELLAKGTVSLKVPWPTKREIPLFSLLLDQSLIRRRFQTTLNYMNTMIEIAKTSSVQNVGDASEKQSS
jgi:hypothetical protein